MSQFAPIRVQIRQDNEAGIIRASLVAEGGSQPIEVATLSAGIARKCPEAWEHFKTMCDAIAVRAVEDIIGIPVESVQRIKPGDKN